MTGLATVTRWDRVGVVSIDSPPVNAIGVVVRRALAIQMQALCDDANVDAIVVTCGGRTFFAGADISEFGKPPERPSLLDVLDVIEGGDKPVVAAIHGTALGGGMEIALVCDRRIAVPSARIGLPEVHLGLLAGAGGTQRLPRLIGPKAALDLMVSGRMVGATEALSLGVIDALAEEGRLVEDAVALAATLVGKQRTRVRDRQDKVEPVRGHPELFADFRKSIARASRGFKAPENIVRAVEAAVTLPFDAGMRRERELFDELHDSVQSAAQRYQFFAQRETSKIPDVPSDTPPLPIRRVGVIGAGTMGGGIAMNFLNAGLPVTLVETSQDALDRGLGVIRQNYEASARRGRMTVEQVEARMALISPRLDIGALSDVDLVIEAVFEELEIKKDIFRRLDAVAREGAILASNTSFLDLDQIAAVTTRPAWVVGLHFFSPANVMQLLEVVRGRETSKPVIATAMKLARQIGKVPVLSGVCHGFIANRIMSRRGAQADALVLEGPTPEAIDEAIHDYGFAMGPFQMIDLVGLDVIGRGETRRTVIGDLVKLDRLGQKKNGGYYDWDESRRPTPSPVAARIIADVAQEQGAVAAGAQAADEIVARLLYPVVNEGAKLLEEGIALRASDIDVAAVLGYNWPVYTGGPMFWADTVGLPVIVEKLKALQRAHGHAFAPSALLERLAAEGGSFSRQTAPAPTPSTTPPAAPRAPTPV
jgi:3-hydroxyacyl-CoA dehydrogenase